LRLQSIHHADAWILLRLHGDCSCTYLSTPHGNTTVERVQHDHHAEDMDKVKPFTLVFPCDMHAFT